MYIRPFMVFGFSIIHIVMYSLYNVRKALDTINPIIHDGLP